MYTYNRVMVGLQLSQLDRRHIDVEALNFLDTLYDLATEDVFYQDLDESTLAELFDYHHDLSDSVKKFLKWCVENKDSLSKLKFETNIAYHGADDQPAIFGLYVDDIFPIPEFGAGRVCLESIEQLNALKEEAISVFSTLDADVFDILKRNNLIDVWFNNHSS